MQEVDYSNADSNTVIHVNSWSLYAEAERDCLSLQLNNYIRHRPYIM